MSEPLTPLNDNYLELLKRGSVLEQMAAIEIDSLRNSHAALVAACMAAAIPLEALRLDNEAGSQLIAPPLRPLIAEACDKLRAALAGRDGK